MIVTDMRYRAVALYTRQLRRPSFARGVKDCLRRRVAHDRHNFPMVAGGRVRFYRQRIDAETQMLVAEWPSHREIDGPPPGRKGL